MEDEESKTRRNLMAVSTLIVLAWWLQAPLDKITEKLLSIPSTGPEFEWRAWSAALFALIYFALRFRFSSDHQNAVTELRGEFHATMKRLLTRWLSWETACFARWGWTPPVLGDGFATVIGAKRNGAGDVLAPVVRIHLTDVVIGRFDSAGRVSPPESGKVFGAVSLIVHRADGNTHEWGGRGLGFDTSVVQRRFLKLWAACFVLLYSKASTALFVPWGIGCLAFVTCCSRLWKAYLQ